MRVWPSATRWAIAIRPTSTLSTLTEAKRVVRCPIVTTPSPSRSRASISSASSATSTKIIPSTRRSRPNVGTADPLAAGVGAVITSRS